MVKKFLLIMILMNWISCSSSNNFNQSLTDKNCERALENIPEKKNDFQLVSKVKEVSGTLLSYSATGAAYSVEILWNVTAFTAAVVVLCSPTFVLAAAGKGAVQPLCFPADFNKIQVPQMGKNMSRDSQFWNCPNVDSISRSIRKVAKCYADRGGDENQSKALKSLQSVEKSGSFYRCLSNKERELFLRDLRLAGAPSITEQFK